MDAFHHQEFAAFNLVLFGGCGDLVTRKLLPALYHLEQADILAPATRIIAVDRDVLRSNAAYVEFVSDHLRLHLQDAIDPLVMQRLCSRILFCALDLQQSATYQTLQHYLSERSQSALFYFAISPSLYAVTCQGLAENNLIDASCRIVVEKPIGHDRDSAADINSQLQRYFSESQIYRVDHFLGKETVLNLLALRFANPLFSLSWDYRVIDHVQITLAEEIGVETRWGYYDSVGQLRDMVQNHMLQLLTLIAMEPPLSLDAQSIRDEKRKVLQALRPIAAHNVERLTVRGQYKAGTLHHRPVSGYLEEDAAHSASTSETFVALRVDIDNWRWSGVPFYLRTGKRMATKCSEVVIYFKAQPHNLFASEQSLLPNRLKIRIQPNEGIDLQMMHKQPGLGAGLELRACQLKLSFDHNFTDHRINDAYERLLREVMLGNQSLFVSREEVDLAWKWIDGITSAWAQTAMPLEYYAAGSWGPEAARVLIEANHHYWEDTYALV